MLVFRLVIHIYRYAGREFPEPCLSDIVLAYADNCGHTNTAAFSARWAWLIVFGLLWYFGASYLFPLIALVDITTAQCLRNALLLALIELKHNLLLLCPLA